MVRRKLQSSAIKFFGLRSGRIERSLIHACATILDPRFKRIDFRDATCASRAISRINSDIKKLVSNKGDRPLHQEPRNGIWSHRIIRTSDVVESGLPLDEASRLYLHSELAEMEECPIKVWHSLSQLNSKSSSVALKYLAIPATSVPSERVFSKAGIIINKLRSSLAPKSRKIGYFT